MSVTADIQQLEPGNLVELYEVDLTSMGGDVQRFHAHLQSGPILWQGNEYSPWPVTSSGFERTGDATQPSPTVTIANVDGSISALCIAFGDMVGAKVKRHRTLAQYLDGQPAADPNEEMPVEVWYIDQKSDETNLQVEFTLASALDLSGRQLPSRQVIATICPEQWAYRGSLCGYTALVYFDKDNNPVSDPAQDVCGRRLSSCKCRFGQNNPLPFGGFPAAGTAGTL